MMAFAEDQLILP